jgi:hypothetical protein
MASYPEFIPRSGACLVSKNVLSGVGQVRWMVREPSQVPADNGWRIFSHVDSSEYLADADNLQIVSFNQACAIEPALIGIYDFAVGSDLELVRNDGRISIIDAATGHPIPVENFYVPEAMRDSREHND